MPGVREHGPEADFMERDSTEDRRDMPSTSSELELRSCLSLRPSLSQHSPGKARKRKMSVPRRILRLLESSKRLQFQNVSLSKKRQMCVNRCIPDVAVPCEGGRSISRSQTLSLLSAARDVSSGTKANAEKNLSEKSLTLSKAYNKKPHSSCEPSNDVCSQSSKEADEESTFETNSRKQRKEVVAIDCEMVGVGPKGRISALARCSIVDYQGRTVYDRHVRPDQPITDYRTKWSGVRERDMVDAVSFGEARDQVVNMVRGKIVVGHAIFNDFAALDLCHPASDTRDTSKCRAFTKLHGGVVKPGQHPSLKTLAKRLLHLEIQRREHCSVEDARATMLLYKLVERRWEEELQSAFPDQEFRTSFLDDHFWPDDLF